MSSLDAAITAQLHSLKANMGNPQMQPRPNQPPGPGVTGVPPGWTGPAPMTGPPAPQAMPVATPQLGPGPPNPGAANPTMMSVAVNNLPFRYQLSEMDLQETCQRWGQVQNVQLYREGLREVGVVIFVDPVDASDCARQLNNVACTFDGPAGGSQGTLTALIGVPEQLAPPVPKPQQGPPGMPLGTNVMGPAMGAMGGAPTAPGPGSFSHQGQMGMGGANMQLASGAIAKSNFGPADAMGKGKGKDVNGKGTNGITWSCKVIVHAERLHPDFPIVTKIVGVNGQNVDHIRSQANCQVELRGQRSGTTDPRTGQELPEPMFLWLASDAPESGLSALEMVKDLLGSVYDEHGQWCHNNKLPWTETLTPGIVENPHLQEGCGHGGLPVQGQPLNHGPPPGQAPPGQGQPPGQGLPPGQGGGDFYGKGEYGPDQGKGDWSHGKGPY